MAIQYSEFGRWDCVEQFYCRCPVGLAPVLVLLLLLYHWGTRNLHQIDCDLMYSQWLSLRYSIHRFRLNIPTFLVVRLEFHPTERFRKVCFE